MFDLFVFTVVFCLFSLLKTYPGCSENSPCLAYATTGLADELLTVADDFQTFLDDVWADDVKPEVTQVTQVTEATQDSTDDSFQTDSVSWNSYEDLSLTAIRKIAKELKIPRYSRLDRAELVFELNTSGTRHIS
jgi:hypothetical protein